MRFFPFFQLSKDSGLPINSGQSSRFPLLNRIQLLSKIQRLNTLLHLSDSDKNDEDQNRTTFSLNTCLRTLFFAGIVQIFLLAGSFLIVPSSAQAITLDTFEGFQEVTSNGGSNITNRSNRTTEGAIGGTRSIDTTSTAGNPALTVTANTTITAPFFFQVSQDATIAASTNLHWDGDTDATTIDYTGLGGIDLTEDTGTGFILTDLFYDYPTSNNATILIRVYDANDASGQTYSDYEILLSRAYNFEDVAVDFAANTGEGPSGPADITNVGAIWINIDGTSPAIDLTLDSFITNGPCPLIPGVGGKVLDDCGECIPPTDPNYNQSCSDCLGIPNGTAVAGTTCDTGEQGACSTGILATSCDCEREVNPTTEICDGVDNNCNGEIDETFTQLGQDCGIDEPNCKVEGTFICGNTGGISCDFDYANAVLDDCGIDIGCDGVPSSGLVPDECGICGGDGSTCKDLGCESMNFFDEIALLDGGAKDQEKLIRSITKLVNRCTRRKRIKNRVKLIRELSHELQLANWILSWTIPTVIVECTSALADEVCVSVSNEQQKTDYQIGSEALEEQGLISARLLGKTCKSRQLRKRWARRVRRQHNKNMTLLAEIPGQTTSCANPTV